MPYLLDGQRLRVGRPFKTADGVSYSQLWATQLSDEQKTAIGITYAADPEKIDSTWYVSSGVYRPLDDVTVDGVTTSGVRPSILEDQKNQAMSRLTSTDWYVTRKAETDTAIPSDVATYRAAVRTACNARETEIKAVSSTEALETLMKAPATLENGDANPAALTQWPTELS